MIFGGIAAHPLAAAGEVFDFYRQFTKSLPDELTAFAGLVHAPDGSGTKIVALAGVPLRRSAAGRVGPETATRVRTAPARPDRPDALPGHQHAARPRVPQGRAQLLEVRVLHGALRRGRPHDGRRVRGGAVDHEWHGRRALPRRGDPHRPDGDGLPPPPARLQPRAHRRMARPVGDRGQRSHGCESPSPRSSRTWRRRCT